jgi:hypothetical protein
MTLLQHLRNTILKLMFLQYLLRTEHPTLQSRFIMSLEFKKVTAMFSNGIFVECHLWERRFALQCKLGLVKNAFKSYPCQFMPLHTLEFYMCEARTRISSSYFTSALTILQGVSKVLDASESNLVMMFLMFGQFKEELTLTLVKL